MIKGLITAASIVAPLSCFAGSIVGQATVIDGDTFRIGPVKIRLHGVDAPESSQTCSRDGEDWRCGQQAALALDEHLKGLHLKCWPKGQSYDRVVAQCWITETGEDIAEWLSLNGWAVAAPKYSQAYLPSEAKAKTAGLGIWGSEFELPWIWRKHKRSEEPSYHMTPPLDLSSKTMK